MDFSYQLYSARNERSLAATLAALKDLGYARVEGWGGQFAEPRELRKMLDGTGLEMPTAHIGFDELQNGAMALDIAAAVGIETVFCPAPPNASYQKPGADWAGLAEALAAIAAKFKAAGRGFGYHNHHWEFARDAAGRTPIETILAASPDLKWEMDLAWVKKAKEEPLAWMDKFGARMAAMHVKDMAPEGQNLDEDGWADVGHGTLDWKNLLVVAQAKTAVKYFVLEHDKPLDALRFARRSMATIQGWA